MQLAYYLVMKAQTLILDMTLNVQLVDKLWITTTLLWDQHLIFTSQIQLG